jgi:hypothetical protein
MTMTKTNKKTTQHPSKPRGSNTDKRDVILPIRLTAEEFAIIEHDAERAGLTRSSYVRSVVLNAPVPRGGKRPHIHREELGKLLGHIGKIGSNLNQIARAANSNIPYSHQVLESSLEDIKILHQDIRRVLGKS